MIHIGVIELVIIVGIVVVLAGGGLWLGLFLRARNKRHAQWWQAHGGYPPPVDPRQYPPPGYPPHPGQAPGRYPPQQ